jgi:hypothetical protein
VARQGQSDWCQWPVTDGFQFKICQAEVQLCPFRVVNKFDFRLVINKTPDNGKLWKMTDAMIQTCFWMDLPVRPEIRDHTKAAKDKVVLISWGQYIPHLGRSWWEQAVAVHPAHTSTADGNVFFKPPAYKIPKGAVGMHSRGAIMLVSEIIFTTVQLTTNGSKNITSSESITVTDMQGMNSWLSRNLTYTCCCM